MNKDQFLLQLRNSLKDLDEHSLREIIYDYEEHFSIGIENGKTEEEIAKSLGHPETIASQYRYESTLRETKKERENNMDTMSVLKAVLAGVGLVFFNLVFVLGIYVGIVAVVFAFFISSIAISFSGIMLILQSFIPFNLSWLSIPFLVEGFTTRIGLFFFGIGFTSLGLLLIIFFTKIGQWIYIITKKYLKANISIIKKAGEYNEA